MPLYVAAPAETMLLSVCNDFKPAQINKFQLSVEGFKLISGSPHRIFYLSIFHRPDFTHSYWISIKLQLDLTKFPKLDIFLLHFSFF